MPSLPPGVSIEDIQALNTLVGQIFDSAQSSIARHSKLVVKLSSLQEKSNSHGLELYFNKIFICMINRILVIKKGESCADRIVKFIESFVSRQVSNGEEEVISTFVEILIQHFRRGLNAKDKTVRFRCCQLIAVTINHIGEITDDLFNGIKFDLIQKLKDKEPSVRLQCSLALCRLQGVEDEEEDEEDEDEIIKSLLYSLRNDSSAEVRRAILLNIIKNTTTLPYLLERARDIHPTNRRCVYSRILKDIGDFRQLSIGMREKVLLWGLQDRDDMVSTSAIKLFSNTWLETTNNDLVELLERLDVMNSKIADKAMISFFNTRRDVLEKLNFNDEFWQALSGESVFLARMFNEYCNSHEDLKELIDNRMPELTKLAFLTEKYLNLLEEQGNDPELEFIIEQLLMIILTNDFSDEIGRRKSLLMLRNSIIKLDHLNESLINLSIEIIYKISVSERDFSQILVELIDDLQDNDVSSNEKQLIILLKCLFVMQSALELIRLPLKDNVHINSLLHALIVPAMENNEPSVRERGIHCLGLCCLLSKDLASENLNIFVQCFAQGHEALKIDSIRILSDILIIHGLEIVNEDNLMTIYKLYYRAVRNTKLPELQALAAEAVCKLLLQGVFTEEELVKTLVVVYFESASAENLQLRQTLGFCLPVYCYSSNENQQRMANIIVDSLRRLSAAFDDGEVTLTPTQIIQQLIDWTDPYKVVGELGHSSLVHIQLAREMLERISQTESRDERKALSSTLSKLNIRPNSDEMTKQIEEIEEELSNILDDDQISEAISKNALIKYKTRLRKIIDQTSFETTEFTEQTANSVELPELAESPEETSNQESEYVVE